MIHSGTVRTQVGILGADVTKWNLKQAWTKSVLRLRFGFGLGLGSGSGSGSGRRGSFCSNLKVVVFPSADAVPLGGLSAPSDVSVLRADIRATRPLGTVISAVYAIFTPGVSWHGTIVRAWIAWHWVNMYGCFFPAVCARQRRHMCMETFACNGKVITKYLSRLF